MSEEGTLVDLLKRALVGDDSSGGPEPFLAAARRQILKDPSKAAGVAYLWLTAVGFTRIFGDGMGFGVNAVDLASPSDFLLAGLRDPLVAIIAAASGAGLFWMSGKAQESRWWSLAFAPTCVALLFLGSILSGAYRHAVVAGSLNGRWFAPLDSTVTFVQDQDGNPEPLPVARFVISAGDHFIFYEILAQQECQQCERCEECQQGLCERCKKCQKCEGERGRTLVVKKDSVKRIELHPRS